MSRIKILSSLAGAGFGAVCMLILCRNNRARPSTTKRSTCTQEQAFQQLLSCADDLDTKLREIEFSNENGIDIDPIIDENIHRISIYAGQIAEEVGTSTYWELMFTVVVKDNAIHCMQPLHTAHRYATKYALEPFSEVMPLNNCNPEKMGSVDRAKCMLEQLYYKLTHSVDWRSLLKEFNT